MGQSVCPGWPGNIIKKYADLFFTLQQGCKGSNCLPVSTCAENPLAVTLHAEDFNVPCARQVKKKVMVSFP